MEGRDALKLEAEVQCRTCRQRRFITWDWRHAGHLPQDPQHTKARCPTCKSGSDFTDYTGRHRLVALPPGEAAPDSYPGFIV